MYIRFTSNEVNTYAKLHWVARLVAHPPRWYSTAWQSRPNPEKSLIFLTYHTILKSSWIKTVLFKYL